MTMAKAIVQHDKGGADVLRWEDVSVGDPGPGQVRIRHTAVGLNYIDVYFRTGHYPAMDLPGTIGMEAAGVIEAVGEAVEHVAVGDRVAYAAPPPGAYCELRVMDAARLVVLPEEIDDRAAAAIMLKGMTAGYLLSRTHKVRAGDTILVQAAAGGVGLLLCDWAKHLGCTVIGTVSSDEKAELAAAHGCDHPIVYTREDFVARVKEITDGAGVAVAYDSVGKTTFLGSFECLGICGHLVSFGQSSGPADPIAPAMLGAKSASLTRPSLFHYAGTRDELDAISRNLFSAMHAGVIGVEVNQTYPLKDAAQAHRDLEARKTTGSTVLLP